MRDTVIARRYANALFTLGKKQGPDACAAHGACLAELEKMLELQPKLALTLKSPVIGLDEKKALLGAILDKLGADKTMRNFCFLLADKDRLDSLAEIAQWYGIMLDESRGLLRGRIITAIKLSSRRQDELKQSLQEKMGKDLELTFSVDPAILGGMVLAVGDRVMDASLRAQLGIMRENLKRGM